MKSTPPIITETPPPVHVDVPPLLPPVETQQDIINPSLPLPGVPPMQTYYPAAEVVRLFLESHSIQQKTVVLDPQETWINGVFIQTDKPLLGTTYIYTKDK